MVSKKEPGLMDIWTCSFFLWPQEGVLRCQGDSMVPVCTCDGPSSPFTPFLQNGMTTVGTGAGVSAVGLLLLFKANWFSQVNLKYFPLKMIPQ